MRERIGGGTQLISLMELGRRILANDITLEDALRHMKEGSFSVVLNWSEDDGELWECSRIVGGLRHTAHHPQPRTAVLGAVVKCTDIPGKQRPQQSLWS